MKQKKNVIIWTLVTAAAIALVVGGSYLATRPLAPITQPQRPQSTYALTDVNKASTTTQCWVAIQGGVYDLTPYVQGDARLVPLCGTDATEAVARLGADFAKNFDNLRIGTLQ